MGKQVLTGWKRPMINTTHTVRGHWQKHQWAIFFSSNTPYADELTYDSYVVWWINIWFKRYLFVLNSLCHIQFTQSTQSLSLLQNFLPSFSNLQWPNYLCKTINYQFFFFFFKPFLFFPNTLPHLMHTSIHSITVITSNFFFLVSLIYNGQTMWNHKIIILEYPLTGTTV